MDYALVFAPSWFMIVYQFMDGSEPCRVVLSVHEGQLFLPGEYVTDENFRMAVNRWSASGFTSRFD
jgi:hypothetical protein